MGEESPEAKNTKHGVCLLNSCAEIYTEVKQIACFGATINFPKFMTL